MVEFKLISKKDNKAEFILKKSTPAYSNSLRRIMLTEVPVMAIEEVEFKTNNSALYDEVIAHRLGLIPLITDLDSYELPESQKDIDENKAKCTLQLTLKEKGPKVVYASDLRSLDPKVKPVFPKTPILELLKDQEIELLATAVLGKGKDHMKWSPCHVWYNYEPKITINNKDIKKFKDMYPPDAFTKGNLDKKKIIDKGLVDAVTSINPDIVKVEYDDTTFIFNVESWGQLPVERIITESLKKFNDKLDEFKKLV